MERTTTCIPCVPSILEGLRRGSTTSAGVDGRGGGGQNGTDGRCGDGGGTVENGGEYPSNASNRPTAPKMNTSATEQTDGSDLPSVTRISAVGNSNANRTLSLQKGKTSFGSAVDQDVVIEGVGIDNQHCYLINEGQVVTFYPLAVLNSVDGFRVTKPTKLYHGSVLCFGQSVYFRFNFPPPPPKTLLIKGSSPGDESRRKLIKLQSKPSAQEVNVTKSSFPVPDASQFYWVDFDKELGLKPPAPIELRPSDDFGRRTDTHNVPPSSACNARHVRNSLPSSSHSWDARPYRVRFPSQDLEIYPKEKSECSSPSITFPSSAPMFTHDSKNGARDAGRFSRPSIDTKDHWRQLDDKSNPVTRLAEIPPSSSSQNGGVTLSLVSRLNLNPCIRDDGEPCKTGPGVFPTEIRYASTESSYPTISTVASSSSDVSSSLHFSSSAYDDYDNVDGMEVAAMVCAATRLTNPPSAAVRIFQLLSNGTKSLQSSGVSESSSLSHDAPQMIPKSSISLESGDRVCDPSIGLMGEDPQDQLSTSSSETCTKELIDREFSAALDFGAKSTECNWQSSDFAEVLCENSLSSAGVCEPVSDVSSASEECADVTVASSKNLDSVVTDLSSTSKLDYTFGSIESSNSVEEDNELSSEQCKDLLFKKAETSITEGKNPADSISEFPLVKERAGTDVCPEEPPVIKPGVDTESIESSNSIKASEFGVKKPEDLQFLMTESSITEEKNSANLIIKSPFMEECGRTNVVCSNKPPIGKPVPESSTGKSVRTERKSIESDKKSPESATVSLFKSLLGRSWSSPLQKGRADHPTSSSSTNELRDHRVNETSQLQIEAVKTVHHGDFGVLAHDFDERLKTGAEDGNISNLAEADTLGGSLPNELPASSQNPWRFNLKDSLKLNLENFKGEKVFTKDTVTTSVFVGVGLDRSRVYPTTSVSSRESHLKGRNGACAKSAKALSSGISSSDQDLRSIAHLEPRSHSNVDYGYMSDSGISVVEDAGRVVRFCRPRGKKSVTFAEQCHAGSLTQVPSGSQLPCETSQAVSLDMNCVAGGRSPTEKISVSENVRTYLEVVDSSLQRGKTADNPAGLSSKDRTKGTKIQNGILNIEAKDINKLKSTVIDSDQLSCLSSVFNSGSQNGSDIEPHDASKVKVVDEKQSVDFDEFGLDDFGESQRDLKRLYEQQRASRLEDQRRAELEKKRLGEILKMCSEFEVGREFEKAKSHEQKSSAAYNKSLNNGTSNSKDAVEQSIMKPCQGSDKTVHISPQIQEQPDHSLPIKFKNNLNSSPAVSQSANNQTIKTDFSPASHVAFGGIDVTVTDRPSALLHSKDCGSLFRDRIPSEPHRSSLDRVHLEGRRPSDECWSTSRNTSHRGLTNGKSKGLQLDWLPELQRDIRTDLKQTISDPGTRQRKAAREGGEGKRALLEQEQPIQMEQLDRIKEKILALEMKEASLLAKAASQRATDVEKIRLRREKLFDMEQRLKATEELTSRSTNVDEAETLKQRCSEMQKARHHLRFLVDNLELQQLEVEACFEDEKELISKELASQRAYLSSLSDQHQNRWPSLQVPEGEVRTISHSLRFSSQKNPEKFSHTIPKIDLQRIRPGGEAFYNEEGRFSHELRKQSPSWPVWERSRDPPGERVVNGALVQWQGPGSTALTGSEDSSMTGSDSLSEKTLSLSSKEDQFQGMERLLALAQAKGLRLVEEQMHQCDVKTEALEQERRCRKELERRLAEEITKNSDVVGQAIRLREKERLQARPLTRYLPVHDHSFDLRQFVVAAGHSVDRCAYLAVTSTSCHGYLMKMGGRIRTWKKRWFAFDRAKRCLSYYGDKSESRPRGVVYFQSIEDVFVDHLHKVKSPVPQLTFCVKTSSRMYYLLASSPDAMCIWIDVIFTGAEGYQQFA